MSSPMDRKHCQSPEPLIDCPNKKPRELYEDGEASFPKAKVLDGSPSKMPQQSQPVGALTVQIRQLLELDGPLAAQGLNLLGFYLAMWECYIVKSAQGLRLVNENSKLQASYDWLVYERDLLTQQLREMELILEDRRKKAIHLQHMMLDCMPSGLMISAHPQE
ncbi:hypothetical protein N7478_010733 [Penicillium angulare]|uniref:uncharacterized protein n=1 Tax=Penicillium angulare TaxID=116970 RepID=UPI00254115F9|nr:uncharacterized protein N7478_010733 [Penicillium angulare]KAJ5267925.1 hypothetical protein N7478_010733 [Penicillium angulare]